MLVIGGCGRVAYGNIYHGSVHDRQFVASVIAAEACGEGEVGMWLVAEVIYNRSVEWNKTPYEVVTAKNQFYGASASNRERLYAECKNGADRASNDVFNGSTGRLTDGALYFLAPGERLRGWHGDFTMAYKRHSFYKGKEE